MALIKTLTIGGVVYDICDEYARNLLYDKADLTYVNTQLGNKADLTYVNTQLGNKANLTYVNTHLDEKLNKQSDGSQEIRRTDSDTPIYLRGKQGDEDQTVYLGFRKDNGNDLGFFGVSTANEPVFFANALGFNASLLISSNIKSSRVYNNYTRRIFKGSAGFLPDIGSDGSATFTFTGIEGHSPSGTVTSQTVVSHRLTAWFCTKPGKTGADNDSNYYKLVILQMPASLLDLSAIGSRTFMIPKNNVVTLTVSGISSAKSISYIADGTWKNTQTGT